MFDAWEDGKKPPAAACGSWESVSGLLASRLCSPFASFLYVFGPAEKLFTHAHSLHTHDTRTSPAQPGTPEICPAPFASFLYVFGPAEKLFTHAHA